MCNTKWIVVAYEEDADPDGLVAAAVTDAYGPFDSRGEAEDFGEHRVYDQRGRTWDVFPLKVG